MCIATAALVIGSVATVAGVGMQMSAQKKAAQGTLIQGQAQNDASQYQAQVARNNAQIANDNADYVLRAGETDMATQNLKGRAHLGAVKAAQAANGVDVNTGSAVDVRAGEATGARQDVLTTQNNAILKAYGYRSQAANDLAQAGLDERTGAAALKGAQISASGSGLAQAGTLLSGVSSLASKWGSYADAHPSPVKTGTG
ncbi:MAG: hypothetical protein WCP82_06890 [Alphaproteobacteria bacterium]